MAPGAPVLLVVAFASPLLVDVGQRQPLFPDFELSCRAQPARRWLVELVGFWTPECMRRKLEALRAARLTRFVLCVDAALNCGEAELPAGAASVRFERRPDPRAVLAIVEAEV